MGSLAAAALLPAEDHHLRFLKTEGRRGRDPVAALSVQTCPVAGHLYPVDPEELCLSAVVKFQCSMMLLNSWDKTVCEQLCCFS